MAEDAEENQFETKNGHGTNSGPSGECMPGDTRVVMGVGKNHPRKNGRRNEETAQNEFHFAGNYRDGRQRMDGSLLVKANITGSQKNQSCHGAGVLETFVDVEGTSAKGKKIALEKG